MQAGESILVAFMSDDDKKLKCDYQPENLNWTANLDGDSTALGTNLGQKPHAENESQLTKDRWPSQAHHLIPHLTIKSHAVAKWLKSGSIIYSDTKYNVDHENNGMWMPYASSLAEWKTGATTASAIAKNWALMFRVMALAQIQLHQGRHSSSNKYGIGECPYHERVKQYLEKIKNNAVSHFNKKPACVDCSGKSQAGKVPPRDNTVRFVDKASEMLERDIRLCRIFVSRIAAEFTQAGGLVQQ